MKHELQRNSVESDPRLLRACNRWIVYVHGLQHVLILKSVDFGQLSTTVFESNAPESTANKRAAQGLSVPPHAFHSWLWRRVTPVGTSKIRMAPPMQRYLSTPRRRRRTDEGREEIEHRAKQLHCGCAVFPCSPDQIRTQLFRENITNPQTHPLCETVHSFEILVSETHTTTEKVLWVWVQTKLETWWHHDTGMSCSFPNHKHVDRWQYFYITVRNCSSEWCWSTKQPHIKQQPITVHPIITSIITKTLRKTVLSSIDAAAAAAEKHQREQRLD